MTKDERGRLVLSPVELSLSEMPERLPAETVRALSQIKWWRGVGQIVLEWGLIVAAVLLCERYWSWPAYLACVAFVGARQHGLLVIMHDTVHARLLKNRQAGDWLGRFTATWPFLLSLDGFRQVHLGHHRFLQTDHDPDFMAQRHDPGYHCPQNKGRIVRRIIFATCGQGVIVMLQILAAYTKQGKTKDAIEISDDKSAKTRALGFWVGLAYAAAALVTISVAHGWRIVLIYWLIPIVTWLHLTLYLRSLGEHYGLKRDHAYRLTRTVYVNPIERLFFAPSNISHHLEHHLYPSVPFYRLAELGKALLNMPEYYRHAHLTRGFIAVLRECTEPAREAPMNNQAFAPPSSAASAKRTPRVAPTIEVSTENQI